MSCMALPILNQEPNISTSLWIGWCVVPFFFSSSVSYFHLFLFGSDRLCYGSIQEDCLAKNDMSLPNKFNGYFSNPYLNFELHEYDMVLSSKALFPPFIIT